MANHKSSIVAVL